jgi:hypothetical protein
MKRPANSLAVITFIITLKKDPLPASPALPLKGENILHKSSISISPSSKSMIRELWVT